MDVDGEAQAPPEEAEKPAGRTRTRRRKTVTASNTRLERRARKVEGTIQEAVKWAQRRVDDRDLDLAGTVERDAEQIGHAVAAVGEHVKPFGSLIDLLFGETGPLSILVALAPTIRVARVEAAEKLRARRARLVEERERRQEQEGQQQEDEEFQGADRPRWAGDDPMPVDTAAAA